MGTSVKISGRMQTTDELAKQIGVSRKRQRAIEKIVDEVARSFDGHIVRQATLAKRSTPKRKAA